MQGAGHHFLTFRFGKSRMIPGNLWFSDLPWAIWCIWFQNHTLTNGVFKWIGYLDFQVIVRMAVSCFGEGLLWQMYIEQGLEGRIWFERRQQLISRRNTDCVPYPTHLSSSRCGSTCATSVYVRHSDCLCCALVHECPASQRTHGTEKKR